MKNLILAVISLCPIFWIEAPLARAQNAARTIVFEVGPYSLHLESGPHESNWEIGSASDAHHAADFEFVRKGDDINNWKELFTYQSFRRNGYPPSPQKYLDTLKAMREKECPGATTWNTIEADENNILYEWQLTKPCLGAPTASQAGVQQHEISRVFYEKDIICIVHYAAKGPGLSPAVRTQWINRWQDAYVSVSGVVNQEIPFPMDKVTAALKSAMESNGCHIANVTPNQIQCNPARGFVNAAVSADDNLTRVRIWASKGAKKDWVAPICDNTIYNLRGAHP